ncbi:hypothetical protein PAHAL_9G473300 [Panicum hallii]|jgi:hypothetical protein|uniref:RING-type E3 ubiquitin transferase n=1 Tax=Panicum hallii TaxID=206008 RepID=A0A2S3IQS8_9POAL|nr:E3 ubiquitin-protein ligase ATL6-like [Panicum hallii]PAN49758.1 hypothetical protein PAHAL_9G473300 [Panicum hallii]
MARRFLTSGTALPPATHGAGAGGAAPPAPRAQGKHHGSSAAKVAIAGNVIVAVLLFAAIVWRVFFSGRGEDDDDDDVAPPALGAVDGAAVPASPSAASTPGASPRAGGLQKHDLLALPVYVHGSCPDQEGRAGGEGRVECAVCISELRDGDTGRILPRCGHRFHAECVDRWFRSHVTCPLCRAVVADGGFGKSYPKI